MQKSTTISKHASLFAILCLTVINFACNSTRMAQTSTPSPLLGQTEQEQPVSDLAADADQLSASVAYADANDEPAAAATNATIIATPPVTKQIAAQAVQAKKTGVSAGKIKTAVSKVLLKTIAKKAEKAQRKFDIKKEKAAKAGKAMDPDIRTGILIGALGLVLIIIGAALSNGLLYTLGGIGVTIGLIVIILAALDVI